MLRKGRGSRGPTQTPDASSFPSGASFPPAAQDEPEDPEAKQERLEAAVEEVFFLLQQHVVDVLIIVPRTRTTWAGRGREIIYVYSCCLTSD